MYVVPGMEPPLFLKTSRSARSSSSHRTSGRIYNFAVRKIKCQDYLTQRASSRVREVEKRMGKAMVKETCHLPSFWINSGNTAFRREFMSSDKEILVASTKPLDASL